MASKKLTKLFGRRVRKVRVDLGLSQDGLAFESGLDRTFIGGIERGERSPTLNSVERIAKALKVRPAELLE